MQTKKPSALLTSSMLLEMASHAAMGIALGLAFAFILTHVALLGIIALIDQSAAPQDTTTMLVVTCVIMFGISTTLTGLALTLTQPGPRVRSSPGRKSVTERTGRVTVIRAHEFK